MPLYEYECESCGHRFEVIQKFSDAPVQACPSCPGTVRRLLSSPAIQFKGSGWYITDYARKPSGSAAQGSATEGKAAESKPETGGTSPAGPTDSGSPAKTLASGDTAAKKD
jgi:putative FmdB family regulatory protein